MVRDHGGHLLRGAEEIVGNTADMLDLASGCSDDIARAPDRERTAADIGRCIFVHVAGRLADHVAMRIAIDHGAELVHQAMVFRLVVPGVGAMLDQVRHGIETKAVHATIQPEAQVVLVEGDRRRLEQVEVRHGLVELRQIGAIGGGLPGIAIEDAPTCRPGILPDIPIAQRAVGRARRFEEDRIAGGAMIDDVIDDDADAACMRLAKQFIEIGQRAVGRFDVAIVADRIAVVAILARADRHQPDATHTQLLEVVQRLGQAAQVADTVAIAVAIAAHEDFSEGALVPTFGQGAGRIAHRHRGHGPQQGRGQGRGGGLGCQGPRQQRQGQSESPRQVQTRWDHANPSGPSRTCHVDKLR